jgi:hypothetical protein
MMPSDGVDTSTRRRVRNGQPSWTGPCSSNVLRISPPFNGGLVAVYDGEQPGRVSCDQKPRRYPMTKPTEHDDDMIMSLLRQGLDQSDPVPPDVTDFATASFSWRTIDAELAQLSYDSTDETSATTVRSTATARVVGFETGAWMIDLEHDAATAELRGQIDPAGRVGVELHVVGAVLATETDDLGRFTFEGVEAGPVAIVIRVDGQEAVKTEWIVL